MKVTFEFIGQMKKRANWKTKKTYEFSEGETIEDILTKDDEFDYDDKTLHFASIKGVKTDEKYEPKDGEVIKLFPRSFGG